MKNRAAEITAHRNAEAERRSKEKAIEDARVRAEIQADRIASGYAKSNTIPIRRHTRRR